MSTKYPDLQSTVFPGSVDTFIQFLNISASDGPLVKQYIDAMNVGDTTTAQNVLQQIPNYVQKLLTANTLNKLSDAMLAVERFYGTDVKPYILEKQTEWSTEISYFSYMGGWTSGTSYHKNNFVKYTTGGLDLIYICTADAPAGTVPTNTSYWRMLTVRGQQGESGVGLTFRQDWDSATQYYTDDVVSSGGSLWVALIDNINKLPSQSPNEWRELVSLQTTTYPIQDYEPPSQTPGELWFNTSPNTGGMHYLRTLENPATPDTMLLGFEAYNDQGLKITGTIDIYTKAEVDAKFADVNTQIANVNTALNSKVPTSRTVNGKALTGNISLTATDVKAGIKNLNLTLTTSSWSGSSAPYTYQLTVSGITSTTDGTLFLTQGASAAQAKAAGEAQIRIGSQTTNRLTLYADGTKPTTNIPVTVRLYGQ